MLLNRVHDGLPLKPVRTVPRGLEQRAQRAAHPIRIDRFTSRRALGSVSARGPGR